MYANKLCSTCRKYLHPRPFCNDMVTYKVTFYIHHNYSQKSSFWIHTPATSWNNKTVNTLAYTCPLSWLICNPTASCLPLTILLIRIFNTINYHYIFSVFLVILVFWLWLDGLITEYLNSPLRFKLWQRMWFSTHTW